MKDILIPFQSRKEITGDKILNTISRVLQSYEEIKITDVIHITATIVSPGSGGGKLINAHEADHNLYVKHYSKAQHGHIKSFSTPSQRDNNLCLPKCIVMGYLFHRDKKLYRKLRRNPARLRNAARLLMREAGLTHDGPCTFDDLKALQLAAACRVVVFDKQLLNAIIHMGKANRQPVVHLCLFDGHYTWIKSINRYMKTDYYCLECNVSY